MDESCQQQCRRHGRNCRLRQRYDVGSKTLFCWRRWRRHIKSGAAHYAYLISGNDVLVDKRSTPLGVLFRMDLGNMPYDGGNLLLSRSELEELGLTPTQKEKFVRRIFGSKELIGNLE